MPKISVVIITYNEAHGLQKVLDTLKWADEVLVLDSFSTDNTQAIAEANNCVFHQKAFIGFGNQKRAAVSLAKNNWILNIDADEVLDAKLQQALANIQLMNDLDVIAFGIKRRFIFLGKELKHSGEERKFYTRLFNRQFANFNDVSVHEEVITNSKPAILDGKLLHYSYLSIQSYFDKFNKYTTGGAKEVLLKNKKVSKIAVMLRLPISFIHLYLIKGLILDGYAGFIWALFSSFYPVVKYAKAIEAQARDSK